MPPTEPTSRYFTIENPVNSNNPIILHTLISHSPSHPNSNSSPTILTLHHWGGSASTSHTHIPALLQHATIISISHRGWGLSTPASPDIASAYSIHALASDILMLLPQLKDEGLITKEAGFVLCGHSMGAKVAVAVCVALLDDDDAAKENPFGRLFRGMLLLAPAPPGVLVLPTEMREQQVSAYGSSESAEWTVRNVLMGEGRMYGGDEDVMIVVRDCLKGSEGAKKGWVEVGMGESVDLGMRRMMLDGGGRRRWGSKRVRVLVSRGDRVETVERVERETVERLRQGGFDVRVRVLERLRNGGDGAGESCCGHLLPLEAPEAVVEELVELLRDIKDAEKV